MSFTDFLARNPHPTEAEIREVLSGHLCRCTGYANIVAAIKEVAATSGGQDHLASGDCSRGFCWGFCHAARRVRVAHCASPLLRGQRNRRDAHAHPAMPDS